MKKYLPIICAALLLVSLTAGAVFAAQGPTARLQEGIAKITEVLKQPEFQQAHIEPSALDQLRPIINQYFDFKLLTMYAVGKRWNDFPEKDQNNIVESFRKLLELTYLQKIQGYNGANVSYLKELIQGSKAMVLTEVTGKDNKYQVNYRLIQADGKWMVYDIIAEGISLVKNYRTQFADILQDHDSDYLLNKIQEKVDELQKNPRGE